MEVNILTYTSKPIETIYKGFKQCYTSGKAIDIKILSQKEMEEFIKKWASKGHGSPLEHVSFTFAISGVSRALTHQLVRHRIASYNQQSQRYVDGKIFKYVMPNLDYIENVKDKLKAKGLILDTIKQIQKNYRLLTELKVKKEDARYILPNATTSNLIVTMNLRALRHFYDERSCKHAQNEIRELSNKMMDLVKEIIPFADYKSKKCGITCFECAGGNE